ncbi:Ig-like domain-containing protein, partial [Streptomyces griseofuscus]|uniref:Ig-like domain-containing protein n=1 Tax=Streptomyces griseofuscus TaxID=146922 RepID=UPI00368001A9
MTIRHQSPSYCCQAAQLAFSGLTVTASAVRRALRRIFPLRHGGHNAPHIPPSWHPGAGGGSRSGGPADTEQADAGKPVKVTAGGGRFSSLTVTDAKDGKLTGRLATGGRTWTSDRNTASGSRYSSRRYVVLAYRRGQALTQDTGTYFGQGALGRAAHEEASVAGESPDRSKQRESSAGATSGNADSVSEARDPRLAVARDGSGGGSGVEQKNSSNGGTDTATKMFRTPAVEEDTAPRDAVSSWLRDADEPEASTDATAKDAEGAGGDAGATGAISGGAEAADAGSDADAKVTAEGNDADADAGSGAKGDAETADDSTDSEYEAGSGLKASVDGKAAAGGAKAGADDTGTKAEGGRKDLESYTADADAEAASDAAEDSKPDTDAKADSVTKVGAEAKTGTGARPSAGAAAAARVKAVVEAGTLGDDAAAKSGAGAKSDAQPKAPVATDTTADAGTKADAKARTDADADAATEASAGAEAKGVAGTKADAAAATDAECVAGVKTDAEAERGSTAGAGGKAAGGGKAVGGSAGGDGEEAPAGGDASRAGGAGGKTADGAAVDQPTTVFKAVRPKDQVDQPTTMLKVGKGAKQDEPESERTSKFVALKDDVRHKPKPAPAEETTAVPQIGPERTTQQPLPPKPPLDLLAELTNTPPPPETPVRTALRRVKIWTPLVLLLVIIFAVVQTLRPLPSPTLALTAKDSYTFDGGRVNLPWPSEGQGWMDGDGIGTMGNFGKQTPVAIGSVAKTMTAYIILRDHPLKPGQEGPKIKVDATAEKEGGY